MGNDNIELEKKYYLEDKNLFQDIKRVIGKYPNYKMIYTEEKKQTDYYYDTKDKRLLSKNMILRLRNKKNRFLLTIKVPTNNCISEFGNERFEYETEGPSKCLFFYKNFILRHLPNEIKLECNVENFENNLIVKNNRETITIENNKIVFEIALDKIEYIGCNCISVIDYQLEIELKSKQENRNELKKICDYIEENVLGLVSITESKYERGVRLTK